MRDKILQRCTTVPGGHEKESVIPAPAAAAAPTAETTEPPQENTNRPIHVPKVALIVVQLDTGVTTVFALLPLEDPNVVLDDPLLQVTPTP